jgi:electron transport complex protein RnfG
MKEKMNVAEVIKTGLILFLITAISAALLAVVNAKTAPIIEENNKETEKNALYSVMPEALGGFEEVSLPEGSASELTKAYVALDEDKNIIGVCAITETTGYDVGIQTVTGVDLDLTVTGVEIISMNETPGLGAKAKEESFRSMYVGKSGTVGVSKASADEHNIQAISGATKTSNGVTKGVNIALETAERILEGGVE